MRGSCGHVAGVGYVFPLRCAADHYRLKDPAMKTIFALLAILPYCSSGQGLYINRNQSVTSIQATYSMTEESVSEQGIEIGHSIGGLLDMGLQLGRGRLDSYYNTLFYGLSTSVYLIKPDNTDGVILSLGAAYRKLDMRYSIYQYNGYLNVGHRGDEFNAGGSAGTRVLANPSLTLLALFTGGINNTSDENHSELDAFYGFGLSWIVRTGIATRVVITPSISITNGTGTTKLKGGFVFLQ